MVASTGLSKLWFVWCSVRPFLSPRTASGRSSNFLLLFVRLGLLLIWFVVLPIRSGLCVIRNLINLSIHVCCCEQKFKQSHTNVNVTFRWLVIIYVLEGLWIEFVCYLQAEPGEGKGVVSIVDVIGVCDVCYSGIQRLSYTVAEFMSWLNIGS